MQKIISLQLMILKLALVQRFLFGYLVFCIKALLFLITTVVYGLFIFALKC
jgi:hypothetical protein